jgi:hypothetical protein
MERVVGIEPTSSAWKAEVLPLNYTRFPNYALTRKNSTFLNFLCPLSFLMAQEKP